MKNLKNSLILLVVAAIVVAGAYYYKENSYSYHLRQAESALHELEAAISGEQPQALLPAAFADDGDVDEDLVADLTEEVVEETEEAIEIAEEINDPEDLEEALEEISDLQEEEIEVLANAADVVEGDVATEVVAEALEVTSEEQDLIEDALDFVADAIESGEEEVTVDVETSEDKEEKENERLVKATELFEEAQAALEALVEAEVSDEEVATFEAKVERIQAALEDGKSGRAFGLSMSIQSKTKHMLRKAEGEEEEEVVEDEDDEDEEGEEEDEDDEEKEDREVDVERLTRAEERFEEAQTAFEELKASEFAGEEEFESLEAKFTRIEEALGEGKVGRAFGISTALQAKSRSMILQVERKTKREERKAEREAEREARSLEREELLKKKTEDRIKGKERGGSGR